MAAVGDGAAVGVVEEGELTAAREAAESPMSRPCLHRALVPGTAASRLLSNFVHTATSIFLLESSRTGTHRVKKAKRQELCKESSQLAWSIVGCSSNKKKKNCCCAAGRPIQLDGGCWGAKNAARQRTKEKRETASASPQRHRAPTSSSSSPVEFLLRRLPQRGRRLPLAGALFSTH